MLRANVTSDKTGNRRFVDFTAPVERHREAVQVRMAKLGIGRDHRARIDAAAQENADGYVRSHQTFFDCLLQQALEFDRIVTRLIERLRLKSDRPEFPLRQS